MNEVLHYIFDVDKLDDAINDYTRHGRPEDIIRSKEDIIAEMK